MTQELPITVSINGRNYQNKVEPRLLLADYIRHHAGLTGTHVGCEHGVCGACTIIFDGKPVRSCIMFAVQADGHELMTVEGLTEDEKKLHPLQQAFWEAHGLQCGFCTPGILMTLLPYLQENSKPSEKQVRDAISGNLCRCTGYQNIVDAALLAAEKMHES
jgi:carbon-monoxide dehydrogenase small subunit